MGWKSKCGEKYNYCGIKVEQEGHISGISLHNIHCVRQKYYNGLDQYKEKSNIYIYKATG